MVTTTLLQNKNRDDSFVSKVGVACVDSRWSSIIGVYSHTTMLTVAVVVVV